MKRQTRSIISVILCIMLVCSFFSCAEKKELQVLFYDNTTLITSEEDVLIVGTGDIDKLTLESKTIDVVVVPDYNEDSISGFGRITENYDIETVYIPDYTDTTEGYNSFIALCEGIDAFVVRVDGSMSFGIGAASVSVVAGMSEFYTDTTDYSLMTKVTMGDNRLLLCGSARSERISEFLQYESQSYTHINLTPAQKGIESSLLEALTPDTLVFTGIEPYVTGYDITEGRLTFKE